MSLINRNQKIFIAGHKGMVGAAIKRLLIKNGYENLMLISKKELDLRNQEEVNKCFRINKPDVVILAAAKVGGIFANDIYPANFLFDNLKIELNVIESAFTNDIQRLLFLGSSCIYPKFATQPIKEESLLNGELEKTNEWYAIAKIAGIKMCDALRKQYGFDAISLMPTNLYGPGDNYHPENSHVFAALIRKFSDAVKLNKKSVECWGSGSPKREFLHVNDLADASLFVLENWSPENINSPKDSRGKNLTFLNVGTGTDLSIKELAEKISLHSGFKGDINWDSTKPDGTPRKLLDVNNINNLGWNSKISLDSGIKDTLDLYRFL